MYHLCNESKLCTIYVMSASYISHIYIYISIYIYLSAVQLVQARSSMYVVRHASAVRQENVRSSIYQLSGRSKLDLARVVWQTQVRPGVYVSSCSRKLDQACICCLAGAS